MTLIVRCVFCSLLFFLSLSISGCPKQIHPVNASVYKVASSKRLLHIQNDIDSRLSAVRSFRALARVKLQKGLTHQSFKQVITFKRPDKLRIDILESSTHRLLAIIAIKEGQIKAIDTQEKVAYIGSDNETNLSKLLSLPMSLEQVMLWFCGQFSPPKTTQLALVRLLEKPDSDDDLLLQYFYKNEKAVNVLLRQMELQGLEKKLINTKIEIMDSLIGPPKLLTKFFDPVVSPSGIAIPNKLTAFIPHEEATFEFEYENYVLNPEIREDDEVFDIKIPSNLQIHDLDNN